MNSSQKKPSTSQKTEFYIGLLSGTSIDGVDAALTKITDKKTSLLATYHEIFDPTLKKELIALSQGCENEINRMGVADRRLGALFAKAALKVLENSAVKKEEVTAIGCHGQTIRHQPRNASEPAFSLQIGDPNTLAEQSKILTVSDFRRRDIAAGGEGAPLMSAFHQAVFSSSEQMRAIVNIGGMSNITWLHKTSDKAQRQTLGFDAGPGNVLLDLWIYKQQGKPFDEGGSWAASGQVNKQLLKKLAAHPFFALPPPKSTGREEFNQEWLDTILSEFTSLAACDVQATLSELTAQSILEALKQCPKFPEAIFVCGGGAHNIDLLQRLHRLCGISVETTTAVGFNPDWVEAAGFAWLARQRLKQEAGNLASVTGASGKRILGGVYPS